MRRQVNRTIVGMLRMLLVGASIACPGALFAQKADAPLPVVTLNRKDPVVFEKEIQPIFQAKCVVCHSANELKGKFDLGTFAGLMKGGKSGVAIVPGKSSESLIVKLLGRTQKPAMPPKDEEPITPNELALVKLWIDQGAKPPASGYERPKITLGVAPATVMPVRGVAVSPDKSAIAAGRANRIHLYDAGSGTFVRTFVDPELKSPDGKPLQSAHLSLIESLAFSPDGRYLASGSFGEVILWDVQTGKIRTRLTGFVDRVVALAFAPKGNLLATGGGAPTEDGELKVFEIPSGKLIVDIKSAHSDTVFGVCFAPDAARLASCGADKFVKVFDLPSGKFVKSFEGHTHHVMDVGWRADGKLLASGGADNVVKIWDFEKGEQTRTMTGHSKQVTRLQFVGTTPQIITCSGDQSVRMWNTDNGGTIRQFSGGSDYLYAVAISPDGAIVASGGEDGIVRVYNGANGQLVKQLVPPGVELPKK
jgi:WD40 repeat protein